MKIIVHMGQGKTGTSALQKSLNASVEMLRARKVLYPQFGRGFDAHHLLVALIGKPNLLPSWTREKLGGAESAVEAAKVAWATTCVELRRSRPELLVLSSEYLIHDADGKAKASINAVLTKLSDDITPVVYVRNPVDHYRARLQQRLKTNSQILPPLNRDVKEAILDTEAAFGRGPELVAFDRKVLHGGDIIEDFATRFLAPWVTAADLPRFKTNVGLSAEALMLMIRLRAEGGDTYETSRRVARLIPRLEALDQSDPPAQSFTLLPEVAEAALRGATGHRWLAETGRLQIPGLDVDKIDGTLPPDWMRTAPPESLFFHDPERLKRLQASIEQFLSEPAPAKQPKKPSQKPAAPQAPQPPKKAQTPPKPLPKPLPKQPASRAPRIRDLLLRFLLRKLASLQDRNTGAVPTRASPIRRSSQGDRNENNSTDGNLDSGTGDRP